MPGKLRSAVLILATGSLLVLLTCAGGFAQKPQETGAAVDPLVRLLLTKGVLSEQDVAGLAGASTPAERNERLAKLLLEKGVISRSDYVQLCPSATLGTTSATPTSTSVVASAASRPLETGSPTIVEAKSALASAPSSPTKTDSNTPTVIPAITPTRMFPVGGLPRDGLKPAFSIGSIRVAPYGFIKATFIHDSSSPGGDDFPLPGFISDTGPGGSPEFHVKARSSRIGTNFEWLDPSPNLTVTGKIEVDFEGNFTRADNRNLSAIRSSTPSIRLAYARLDYKLGDSEDAARHRAQMHEYRSAMQAVYAGKKVKCALVFADGVVREV